MFRGHNEIETNSFCTSVRGSSDDCPHFEKSLSILECLKLKLGGEK